MDLNRLQKLAGLPLTEAKSKEVKLPEVELTHFDDSSDFEDAFDAAEAAVKQAVKIMESKAMDEWMNQTQANFKNFKIASYTKALESLKNAEDQLNHLYTKLTDE
jgi:hypothetical protein